MRLPIIALLVASFIIFLSLAAFPGGIRTQDLYNPIDPRLPGTGILLLHRLEIANGSALSLYPFAKDTANAPGFNDLLATYFSQPQKHLIKLAKDDFLFWGDLRVKLNWLGINETNRNISNLQSSITALGKAKIENKLEFFEEITAFRSDSTHDLSRASGTGEFLADPFLFYPPLWQGPVAGNKSVLDFQADRAFIKTDIWGVNIQTGRDRIQTKVGYRNGLLFSGLARPVDMFYRLDYDIWRFQFMALSGQLTAEGKRYISAKRVGFRLAHNLHIGVTEAAAYYDDPTAYINPLMPIYLTQRQRPNNDDNLIASFDISYTPVKNFNVYFEFMDDDFIVFSGGASKYGFLAGLYKSQLLDERIDFHLEYAQVRKYAYTHVTHINNWQYEGQPFGFWLGPDADELYSELGYFLSPTSRINMGFNYTRKGEGDLYHPYEDIGGDKTPLFPSGMVEKGTGVWFDLKYNVNNLDICGRVGYRHIINPHNEKGRRDSYLAHMAIIYSL